MRMTRDEKRDKKSECLCVSEMTAAKIEFIQAQKKLLTSRVGELVGPTVGLDDGCSKDREQDISCCVSKCDVEVSSKSQEIESTNNRSSLPQMLG